MYKSFNRTGYDARRDSARASGASTLALFIFICAVVAGSSVSALATGIGDVEIHLNGGRDVAYIGEPNIVEIWIRNDAPLTDMHLGFEFQIGAEYEFNLGYGSHGLINEEGSAVGVWDVSGGVMVNHDIDDIPPDHVAIGGAAVFDPLPTQTLHGLCYTLEVYIMPGVTPMIDGFVIDQYIAPPQYDWAFVDAGGSYEPTFNGRAPISFDIVEPPGELCDWLGYSCGIFYYWRVPNLDNTDIHNMRFTPPSDCCTLKAVRMALWDGYEGFSNESGEGIDILVYNDDGTGLPGSLLFTKNVPGSELEFWPGLLTVDMNEAGLVFFGDDFHVAYTVHNQEIDNIALFSDDGTCGANRSSLSDDGVWTRTYDWWEIDINFNIEALTCCTLMCEADGDIDNNGTDLAIADMVYLGRFLNECGPAPHDPYSADLNGDCVVDINDYNLFADYMSDGLVVFEPFGGYPVETCCQPELRREKPYWEYWRGEVSSLGNACMDTADGSLVVSDLGETGEDGFRLEVPPAEEITVDIGDLGSFDEGGTMLFLCLDSLEWGCCQHYDPVFGTNLGCEHTTSMFCFSPYFSPGEICYADGVCRWPELVLDTLAGLYHDRYCLEAGASHYWELHFPASAGEPCYSIWNYQDTSGSSYTLEVLDSTGQQVATANCITGQAIKVQAIPPTSVTVGSENRMTWDSSIWIEIPGGQEVYGTEIRAVAGGGRSIDGRYEVLHVRGCNVPAMTVDDVTVVDAYLCGDCDGNGFVNVSDVVYLIAYVFGTGPAPDPMERGDVDCNGYINVSDIVYLINYVFGTGPEPCAQCRGGTGKKAQAEVRSTSAGRATVSCQQIDAGTYSISIDADQPIAGIQLEFEIAGFNGGEIEIHKSDRCKDLQVFSRDSGGLLRIGLLDFEGEHHLAAGSGEAVTLVLDDINGDAVELVDVVLADEEAREFEVDLENLHKSSTLPIAFSLGQNQPNPFNPTTEISYAIPEAAHVSLEVFNVVGQKVKTLVDDYQSAGRYRVQWTGTDDHENSLASGVYLYRLNADTFSDCKKMMLLK
jgi:hypothetical protein